MAKRKTFPQLVAAEERTEKAMRRAFKAWNQARDARARAEKRLDRQFNHRAAIGGEIDLRDLATNMPTLHNDADQ